MEASVWWLIAIPILFGLGWFAAQLDAAQWFTNTRQLPESYFKGLNFLLNDQYEQAVGAFEEVAKLDPETAELYFALGSLFRRRGETERAIRIHRNLLERADLPESQRQLALFCLGQDYINAGIFDRAEVAFNSLADTQYAGQAQRELAKLYEKESNWDAAVTSLQRYLKPAHAASPPPSAVQLQVAYLDLSHYACEQAQQHLQAKAYVLAQTAIDLAQQAQSLSNAANPRIAVLQASLYCMTDKLEQAHALFDTAIRSDAKLASIAIQTILQHSPDPAASLIVAQRWALTYPSADTIKPVLKALNAPPSQASSHPSTHTSSQLLQALADTLKRPAQQLSAAHLLLTQGPQSADWTQAALSTVESLVARYDKPTCTQCGFKASRHHWRCPGCARWNTLPYTGAASL